jgi:hypothetical protein
VAAALCALTTDLDSCLQNASSFQEKVTIPADILVPAIVRQLTLRSTSDRAVRALASLLAVSSIVQNNDFSHAVYLYGGRQAMDDIMTLLERTGSDRKTLFVQEQAARAMFYLTDSSILSTLEVKQEQLHSKSDDTTHGGVDCLDMDRALCSMLDHLSSQQESSIATMVGGLDSKLGGGRSTTCMAAKDIAAANASGQDGDEYRID